MLIACWSAKGGSGTTVVAAAFALGVASEPSSGDADPGAVLVDLAGDLPAVLGIEEPPGPGLAEWLAAGPDVGVEALARLAVPVGRGAVLLPRGHGPLDGEGEQLAAALCTLAPAVVVDCGTAPDGVAFGVAAASPRSVLVTRACYLALRRAASSPLRPSDAVVVVEPGRSLGAPDVGAVLGVPVASVPFDPAVARAVDAGLLASRLPRSLARVGAAA